MKITVLAVGRSAQRLLAEATDDYLARAARYMPVEMAVVPDVKNGASMPAEQRKRLEGEALLGRISASDRVVLLDERGKRLTSTAFAAEIEQCANRGVKRLVLVIGGPFGFSQEVYARADAKLSLSDMTFTHEMVRLFIAEQLYRAMTIIRGERYHHD